ncbi:MAG: peptide chain release factor N(5)-glutamine methyltransferase [Rickettsiaceae bacterium H1]|nr:peptide chain release factor N(5)-glutamine methyltransferase [Rickettsiaceae bacterium H1]
MEKKNIANITYNAKKLLKNISNSPNLDIELLLSHVLNKDRKEILSQPELILSNKEQNNFYRLLKKRSDRMSIAQILGKKDFWKHEFIVSNHTLVPRPDSEILISALLELYPNKIQSIKIADFGTGTGCLIISSLLEYKNAYGTAFEKSRLAHQTAKKNLYRHNLLSRLKIIFGSWEKCRDQVDVIISNPPYIKKNIIKTLPQTIARYEPKLALDGGNSSLNCYYSIMKTTKKCLKRKGHLLIEIGNEKQLLQARKIANYFSLKLHKSYQDLSGSTRCIAFKPNNIVLG